MKKTFLILLIGVLLICSVGVFASCNVNIPSNNDLASSDETTVASTPAQTTPAQTTPDETTPEETTPEVTTPEVTTPEVTTPEVTTPEETTPEVTTPEETTPEVTSPEVTTSPSDSLLPPPINLGSEDAPYVYKALVRTGDPSVTEQEQYIIGNNGFACIDFWVDGDAYYEDAISYATYLKNARIEENYNCRIEQISQQGDMAAQLKTYYLNGQKLDLTIILAKAAANAATQGLLSNLNTMSTLDFTHPSYDQNSIKELAIGDRLYYLSGDMNVSTMEVVAPTVVNLEMYNDYVDYFVELFGNDPTYADIYSLVLNKKWTIDTMLTMATAINCDVDDSDGKALGSQPGDVLGYFAYTGMGLYYFYGSGGRLTEIDEEGNITLALEKHNNLFDYLFDKFNAKEGANAAWMPNGYSGPRWDIYSSGRCLFTEMTLFDIRTQLHRASPFQYGILPNPTYGEGDDYHSVVNFTNCNHLWAIPTKVNNSENAQILMNAFAAYSNVELTDSTMYAYYARTLYFTTAPEAGSREVMDIIKNSMVYDIALLYDWDKMGSITLGEMTVSARGSYANNVANQEEIKEILEETVDQLKNPQIILQ